MGDQQGLGAAYQDRGSPEEVAEGVIEEVDEGGSVEVCVAHQLVGKECLTRATAEQAAHLPIAHVHLMRDFLWVQQDGQDTQQLLGGPPQRNLWQGGELSCVPAGTVPWVSPGSGA